MTQGPDISQESVLKKWIALELGRMNDGIVTERPRLTDLLEATHPAAVTRGKKEFVFSKSTLIVLKKELPPELRGRLRLPIIFFFDSNVPDSCHLTDEVALETLKVLGELSGLRTMTQGKLWIGRALVYAMMGKYPSLIQIMMH
jgi:uncharacterized protein (UPF0216 family)